MKKYYLLCRIVPIFNDSVQDDIRKKENCNFFNDGKCDKDNKKCIVYKYIREK